MSGREMILARAAVSALAAVACSACAPDVLPIGADWPASTDAGASDGPGPDAPAASSVCQFAFCENFETPHPGGRGGDLDEQVWRVGRFSYIATQFWVRGGASTDDQAMFPATFCGQPFNDIRPDQDMKSCDGVGVDGPSRQLNEVFDDLDGLGMNAMGIRQPFDFTGRTGKIVWDVDAKINPLNVGHGWWIEVWLTEDPAPLPYHPLSGMPVALPRRALGLSFAFGTNCDETAQAWQTVLEDVFVSDGYQQVHEYFRGDPAIVDTEPKCFRSADGRLNRMELHVSQDQAELWASDYDDPTHPKLRATVSPLDLQFSRAYVHFIHAQFQAIKDDAAPAQTYRWDNIAFDGPKEPLPSAYDIADNSTPADFDAGVVLSYDLSKGQTQTFTVPDVNLDSAAGASLNFDLIAVQGLTMEARFNAGAWHSLVVPDGEPSERALRSFSMAVPVSELVTGSNSIDVRVPSVVQDEAIGNIDLTVERSR
jgi:hypothetical protein